ncbi:MAG: DUF1800 family protein [Gemmataceae bacterium]
MIDPKWAWEPYSPSSEAPWDIRRVGHLYRRAAFGANWAELREGLSQSPQKLIDELLAGGSDGPAFPESIKKGNEGELLPAWWLKRILETKNPFREKLTIFWHNHFATSQAKVRNAGFMIGMIELFHKHALGNFTDLLQEVSKDPAMLIWLDAATSKKGIPNENYARELMELFSLGIGHYTEADIREAAKAFTGWEIKGKQSHFNKSEHDNSQKTVLGKSGRFQGEDVVKICLDQPACAEFICGKLFRFFISESLPPTPELIDPLAQEFRDSGYNFGKLVERVLRSNIFFSEHAYRARVKSPVDFAIGIVRGLEGNVSTIALEQALEGLGQRLCYPPSVKGWDGGAAWLNGQTLLFRQNLALALTSTEDDRFKSRTDPARLAKHYEQTDADKPVDFFLKLFLQNDVSVGTRERLTQYLATARKQKPPVYWTDDQAADHPVRALCHLVLTLPEFQLD